MTGVIVSHPLFGRGQVLEVRNAAREAVVRFDNGIRAVVQRNMLTELDVPGAPPLPPPAPLPPRRESAHTPADLPRLASRRTIEALRQRSDFVATLDLDARCEITGSERNNGGLEPLQPSRKASCNGIGPDSNR